jgi:hypothetical protein
MAGLVGRSAWLAVHQIDIETLDSHALIRQPLAQGGQVFDDGGAGGVGLGLQTRHHDTVVNAEIEAKRTEFRRAEAEANFAVALLSGCKGARDASEQALGVDRRN